MTILDIFWIISIITYELQNVYAPHVNRFSIPESFISWTCFQHNRKCCFLLSSCRFCCWLYLCILTSSLNSSVLLFVNIYSVLLQCYKGSVLQISLLTHYILRLLFFGMSGSDLGPGWNIKVLYKTIVFMKTSQLQNLHNLYI